MLFKMILEGAREEERGIARGFLKHIVAGFAGGLALGGGLVAGIFLMLGDLQLNVPIVFVAAMLLQFGPIGGLVGAGVYLSRITNRSREEDAPEDEDGDKPGGSSKAPATETKAPRAPRPPRSSPLPVPA